MITIEGDFIIYLFVIQKYDDSKAFSSTILKHASEVLPW